MEIRWDSLNIKYSKQIYDKNKFNKQQTNIYIQYTTKIKTEFKRLDKEIIDQFLLPVPQELCDLIKEEYITNVKQCRNIMKCYELIDELTRMKAPINKSQETTFERQIYTARQELKEMKSDETIHSITNRP